MPFRNSYNPQRCQMLRKTETEKMSIKGITSLSLVDWDNVPCATVFIGGCNFRCPWCVSEGTQILMSDYTWIDIENIKIGDKIIGLSENPKSSKFIDTVVRKTFKRKVSALLDITLENGIHLNVTPEHKILSMRPQKHWYRAENLLNKNIIFMGKPTKINNEFLRGWAAGIMDGDGNFYTSKKGYKTASLRMCYRNKSLIQLFHKLLVQWGYHPYYKEYRRLVQSRLSITQEANNLFQLLYKRKDTQDFVRGWISGILDSEGHIYQNKLYIAQKKIPIIAKIRKYLSFLNIKYYEDVYNAHRFIIHKSPSYISECRPFHKKFYAKNFSLKLSRKILVKKIDVINQEKYVFNLETSTKNFIANGILVHNCQNAPLVLHPESYGTIHSDELLQGIEGLGKYIEGVCITGGEPTLYEDLPKLLKSIKGLGLKTKLDTNGKCSRELKYLIEHELIDYIAMDVKAPLINEKYAEAVGIPIYEAELCDIQYSIDIIRQSGIDYEFRTTVVPGLHSVKDIEQIAKYAIQGSKKYVIQNFWNAGELINKCYAKVPSFGQTELEAFANAARPYVKEVKIRDIIQKS